MQIAKKTLMARANLGRHYMEQTQAWMREEIAADRRPTKERVGTYIRETWPDLNHSLAMAVLMKAVEGNPELEPKPAPLPRQVGRPLLTVSPEELTEVGRVLYGDQWVSQMAKALDVAPQEIADRLHPFSPAGWEMRLAFRDLLNAKLAETETPSAKLVDLADWYNENYALSPKP